MELGLCLNDSIPTGERSGLLTRTGATEGASLSIPTSYSTAFVELEREVLTVTFYLESIQADSCK
jgi:hypothetical protein